MINRYNYQRMAQGDGTAIGVHLLGGQTKLIYAVGGLRGKGLVDFVDVDIVEGETGLLDSHWDSSSGANAHHCGFDTHSSKASEDTENRQTQLLGIRPIYY